MGGTGLEPVTPSLSTRSSVSPRYAEVHSERSIEPNLSASERFSERERTVSVAIVATGRDPIFLLRLKRMHEDGRPADTPAR
jgi:hypothetical protein